ncbi:MAG: hypothetical protein DWI28_06190 [Planctomycetota bacterium]|nr:MAG: hypothetical protein DWI28_06190 [Planctomycetota bacterium]
MIVLPFKNNASWFISLSLGQSQASIRGLKWMTLTKIGRSSEGQGTTACSERCDSGQSPARTNRVRLLTQDIAKRGSGHRP